MKLNPDCVRDILLCIEERSDGTHLILFDPKNATDFLPKYTFDEIYYHINQCNLNGFLYQCQPLLNGNFLIKDLTPKAHEFLANIRKETIWNKTKSIGAKLGSTSLTALFQIAEDLISNAIKNCF